MDGGAAGTDSEEERMLREYGLLGDGETSTSSGGGAAGSEPVLLPVLRAADVQLTSQELGSGAFGRVMLGRFHGRDVAVKLLPLLGPAHSRVALRREVAALASLSHRCSSMARLVGITVKDGRLALVMCRYQCSLAQSLAKQPGGRMASDEATLLARDLLRGLAQLHCHGVVMADLKPDNVLLDEAGAPLLCDFGLSRAMRSTLGQHAALSQVAGTANYMSPEQSMVGSGGGGGSAAGGAAGTSTNTSSAGADALISPKSDMWAFGCTLLHALTGRPPWAGLHIGQISVQVGVHKRAPDVPTDLPPNLRSVLLSCLQPDPARRPSAAEALASLEQELRRCIRTAPPPPRPAGASANPHAAAAEPATPSRDATPELPPPQQQQQQPPTLPMTEEQLAAGMSEMLRSVERLKDRISELQAQARGGIGSGYYDESLPALYMQIDEAMDEWMRLREKLVLRRSRRGAAAPPAALQQQAAPEEVSEQPGEEEQDLERREHGLRRELAAARRALDHVSGQLEQRRGVLAAADAAEGLAVPPIGTWRHAWGSDPATTALRQVLHDHQTLARSLEMELSPVASRRLQLQVVRMGRRLRRREAAWRTLLSTDTWEQGDPRLVPAAADPGAGQSDGGRGQPQPPPQLQGQQQLPQPPHLQQQAAANGSPAGTSGPQPPIPHTVGPALSIPSVFLQPSMLARAPEHAPSPRVVASVTMPANGRGLHDEPCANLVAAARGAGGWLAHFGILYEHLDLAVLKLNALGEPLGYTSWARGAVGNNGIDGGCWLQALQLRPGAAPLPRQVVVLDTRVPPPRVSVVLHGCWGTNTATHVVVKPTFSSEQLGAAALAALPPAARARRLHTGGAFELIVDDRRRHVRALLGSGLVRPGAVLHMREREVVDNDTTLEVEWHRVTSRVTCTLGVGANWLVKELKEQIGPMVPGLQERINSGTIGVQVPGRRDVCDDCRELSEYGIGAPGRLLVRLVERQSS
ncbi:hypothetical protein HXX76_003576 [Chlamydomonas incerta]|uniref:Protein kinase domain-containing protein n=1 Tax=Chlamydomonas incerta TaxID=51695 RepID=A0A835THZ5_CHLIN|nr:hypothetical protein HXX76_003576 [Chlamydomonas incerta]|eukprot:KAG2440719.1 hypothetical protein HXX76_003576 [Chlamydomonas incerta]